MGAHRITIMITLRHHTRRFFNLSLHTRLTRLLNMNRGRLQFLTLDINRLLPNANRQLRASKAILFTIHHRTGVFTPHTALRLDRFHHERGLILTRFQRRAGRHQPITTLLVRSLRLARHLHVIQVTLIRNLRNYRHAINIATVNLRLHIARNGHRFNLELTLRDTLRRTITLIMVAWFVNHAHYTRMMRRKLALNLNNAVRIALDAHPATLNRIRLPVFSHRLRPATTITPQP